MISTVIKLHRKTAGMIFLTRTTLEISYSIIRKQFSKEYV